jgi:hypothetical protein
VQDLTGRGRANKNLSLFSTVFVWFIIAAILLNAPPVCNAANPEYSELTAPEKVLTMLEEVVGLDIAEYSVELDFHAQAPFLYYDVLPQEDVKYIFGSNESELEVICAFVDEKLRSMNIYINDGSPLTTQPFTTPLEMAKDFLDRYQVQSEESYYSTMRSMLNNVEADKNITKTAEDIKLEVTVTANRTDFRWKYVFNGVEATSKCVALNFKQGFLKYFIDSWSLWTIGSTDLNVSEEEAIEIAMNATENHSWNLSSGTTVTEFNIVGVSETSLQIGNYPTKNESRGGDPLTLYPGWRVKLYFDKLYPGQVYGLDIAIWADTGEVNDIRELLYLGDVPYSGEPADNEDTTKQPSTEEPNNNYASPNPHLTTILLTTLIASILVVIVVIIYSKQKKKNAHNLNSE